MSVPAFVNVNEGWLVLGDCSGAQYISMLEHTIDGGRTWTVINRNVLPPASPADAVNPDIYFFDSHIGFMAVGPKLFKTTDGGRKWTAVATSGS
jgi:photosystem II stability/assembly factor-like uncharacterized protein